MKKNKKLGNYPGMLITISLTLALFLIGFCGWISLSSRELIHYVRSNVEVQIYLDRDISKEKIDAVEQQLKNLSHLEGATFQFISKEEIANKFAKETKESHQEILGDNPFRDAFSLKLAKEKISSSWLEDLNKEVNTIDGVFELDYAKDFVEAIVSNANKVYLVVSAIVLIFLIATLILINNTIKLALYSQRFIIRTMQLIGATNAFIQKPFLKRGLMQGLSAGFFAILLIYIIQQIAVRNIEGLNLIQNSEMIFFIGAVLLILGPIIGFLSTFQSIVKYLNMDLDDLYEYGK